MRIEITVFASLKDHFEPNFFLEVPDGSRVKTLLEKLSEMKESASGILKKCRVAIGPALVSDEKILQNGEHIFILPPSSGG